MKFFWTDAAIPASRLEKENNNDCLSCGKTINHPLCSGCITDAYKQWISQWVKKYQKEEKVIHEKIHEFLEGHKHFNGKGKRCVACREKNTHTCPYCSTEHLYIITKESGFGVKALTEFLFIFNFDFAHKGYSHELDAMGGY